MSDITVYGLTMGQHFIEDIAILVPYNVVVTIPADQAYRSKDLWRAINQRKVFQLKAGPGQVPWTPPQPVPGAPQDQAQVLQAMEEQRAQNAALMAALAEQRAAIQSLTDTVANLRVSQAHVAAGSPAQASDVVDGSVPTFIPSTVKPEVTEQRIRDNAEESGDTGVADARSRLRAIRRGR